MGPGVPVAPRRVFGVHLEAGPDAGKRTWVCRAHPGSGGVRVESVDRLADLPGGGGGPETACAALVSKVLDAPRSAWGFDFAFGLPLGLAAREVDAAASEAAWRDRVSVLAAESPDTAVDRCSEELQATRHRRKTDPPDQTGPLDEARLAASVLGLSRVALPLRGRAGTVLLPLDPLPAVVDGMPIAMRANMPSTYVLEVAPRAILEALDAGADPARALAAVGLVRPMSRRLRGVCEDRSGALLSVAAAVAAWRGYRTEDHHRLHADSSYRFEGFTYS